MPPAERPRNLALLVASGTRARLELQRGVAADVLRGARPGPTLWLWVPRGGEDPSLQQALGELRDELDPGELRGSLGLLLDGPTPPIGRESSPHAREVAGIGRDATGVVLLTGPPSGQRVVTHAAADLGAPRDRRLARDLGLRFVAPAVHQPALNRTLLSSPLAWLVAGESDRLDRAIVDVVRDALRGLLVAVGLLAGEREQPREGATLRTLVPVEIPAPGIVELAVDVGAFVRRGETLAQLGEPGLARRALLAPASGVVLYARTGRLLDGAAAVIARLPAPPAAPMAATDAQLGWCELVDLPELGVVGLRAKIDTGARTSALHVQSQQLLERRARGRALYEIEVPAGERGRTVRAQVEVVEHAVVRDSGGHAERRPVIETLLRVGGRERRVRVSLTDRGDMRFPMLVGRTALDARTRIDPTRSFVTRAPRRRRDATPD